MGSWAQQDGNKKIRKNCQLQKATEEVYKIEPHNPCCGFLSEATTATTQSAATCHMIDKYFPAALKQLQSVRPSLLAELKGVSAFIARTIFGSILSSLLIDYTYFLLSVTFQRGLGCLS
jgi:hypothetical protein